MYQALKDILKMGQFIQYTENRPQIELDEDRFEPVGLPMPRDVVLFSTRDNTEIREGIVVDTCNKAYKLHDPSDNQERWVRIDQIHGNLGPDYYTKEQYEQRGYEQPPKLPTGTYILHEHDRTPLLIEKEKINGIYYYRYADSGTGFKLTQNEENSLKTFSEPHTGNYLVEPGLYTLPEDDDEWTTYEVVPYANQCWIREIGDYTLIKLTEEKARQLHRVEVDTDDQDVIIITPDNLVSSMETPQTNQPSPDRPDE